MPSLAVITRARASAVETITELIEQSLALGCGQRLQQHRGGVNLPATPSGAFLEQLRASYTQHQDRGAPREIHDVVDQVHQHRLGPLQVVHMQDHWALGGERLEQPPDLPEQLLGSRGSAGSESVDHRLRDVPGASECLKQRPEGDAFAVVQTPATEHGCGLLDACKEGRHQPRLPHSGGPQQCE